MKDSKKQVFTDEEIAFEEAMEVLLPDGRIFMVGPQYRWEVARDADGLVCSTVLKENRHCGFIFTKKGEDDFSRESVSYDQSMDLYVTYKEVRQAINMANDRVEREREKVEASIQKAWDSLA